MAAENGKNPLPKSAKEAVLTGYIFDPENRPPEYYEVGGVGGFEFIEGKIELVHVSNMRNVTPEVDLLIPFRARLELGKPQRPKPIEDV
jgi:hypothetical protein